MKKYIALLLCLAMALSLAACSPSENGGDGTTAALPNDTTPSQTQPQQETTPAEKGFTFTAGGVEIAMKAEASPILAALGEPKSYTEETSCAFTGLDKTYFFGSFYLNTYPQGDKDHVFAAWFADDTVTTAEGIYIGSTQAAVEAAYGTEGYNGSNAYIMNKGESKLTIILTDGVVSSIVYDAVFE